MLFYWNEKRKPCWYIGFYILLLEILASWHLYGHSAWLSSVSVPKWNVLYASSLMLSWVIEVPELTAGHSQTWQLDSGSMNGCRIGIWGNSCNLFTDWMVFWGYERIWNHLTNLPVSKVHGANMGPIWGRQAPGGPHVGPMNFVIWARMCLILCLY